MLTLLVVITIILLLAAGAAASARRPGWLPEVYWRIAVCESGHLPPNWRHKTRDYEGGYGFFEGSWDQYKPAGYPADADQATPWQQYVVARRIARLFGFLEPWGCARNNAWVNAAVGAVGNRA